MSYETEYHDEEINCSWKTEKGTCGEPFIWTAKDQAFYAEKGYTKPKYCRTHREMRKQQQQGTFGPALREVRSKHNKGHNSRRSDKDEFGL